MGDDLDAEYFSSWYADMGASAEKDRVWTRALRLPDHVLSTSLLTGPALDEVARLLALGPDDVLLDLACGRSGYGLELVARSGARLVGIDFAPAAIEQAGANAERLGLADRVEFRVGDMTATGLDAGAVTAVLCIDAVQFPDDPLAPAREAHRVLVAGGRVVLTGWEAADPGDSSVPERIRRVDLGGSLRAAGFVAVEAGERADWAAAERQAWREVVALPETDDPAMRSLRAEGRRALSRPGGLRRVLAHGRRP